MAIRDSWRRALVFSGLVDDSDASTPDYLVRFEPASDPTAPDPHPDPDPAGGYRPAGAQEIVVRRMAAPDVYAPPPPAYAEPTYAPPPPAYAEPTYAPPRPAYAEPTPAPPPPAYAGPPPPPAYAGPPPPPAYAEPTYAPPPPAYARPAPPPAPAPAPAPAAAAAPVRVRGPEPVAPPPYPSSPPPARDVPVQRILPRSFNDAQPLADRFKAGGPVVLDLQGVETDLAKRLIGFASGLTYGRDGSMERLGDRVFLLVPRDVEVPAGQRARLAAQGSLHRA